MRFIGLSILNRPYLSSSLCRSRLRYEAKNATELRGNSSSAMPSRHTPNKGFEEISYSSDLNAYGRSGPMRIPSNPVDVRTCERMWLHRPLKPNPCAIQSHPRLDNEGSEDEPKNVEPDIVRWLVTAISPPALVGLVI